MTLVAPPRKPRDPAFARPRESEALDVSPQDRASGMVVALFVLLGTIVLVMLAVWLSSGVRFNVPAKVTLAQPAGGGSPGAGADAERPLEEVNSDENIVREVRIEQTLHTVGDVVASQAAAFESLTAGTRGGGTGDGPSDRDNRGPGPSDGPTAAAQLPAWEVHFNASSLELYAAQLDFFGIELGAIGGGKTTVDYAARLSEPAPVTRSAPGSAEQRRYLVWRKGPLAAADKSLLEKAKIDTTGRIILQFLPAEVEVRMTELEIAFAGKQPGEIRRTVFGVKGSGGQYEFYVVEQDHR